jgi:hypothetical protein
MKAQTKETQDQMSSASALKELEDGNQRFVEKKQLNRDLMQ